MITLLIYLGIGFFIFGCGYGHGHQKGYWVAKEEARKEVEQALDEKERGISELRNWQKYGEAIHQRQIADIEAKHKLAIDNVITVTKFYYQKERTIRESQHGHN